MNLIHSKGIHEILFYSAAWTVMPWETSEKIGDPGIHNQFLTACHKRKPTGVVQFFFSTTTRIKCDVHHLLKKCEVHHLIWSNQVMKPSFLDFHSPIPRPQNLRHSIPRWPRIYNTWFSIGTFPDGLVCGLLHIFMKSSTKAPFSHGRFLPACFLLGCVAPKPLMEIERSFTPPEGYFSNNLISENEF